MSILAVDARAHLCKDTWRAVPAAGITGSQVTQWVTYMTLDPADGPKEAVHIDQQGDFTYAGRGAEGWQP